MSCRNISCEGQSFGHEAREGQGSDHAGPAGPNEDLFFKKIFILNKMENSSQFLSRGVLRSDLGF